MRDKTNFSGEPWLPLSRGYIDVTRIGSTTKEFVKGWEDDEWDCSGGPISTPYRAPECKRCEYCKRMSETKWGNCVGCGAPL